MLGQHNPSSLYPNKKTVPPFSRMHTGLCITVWVCNVSKDYCNKAHNYLSSQNKTSVSGLNVRGNELQRSYLDCNYHCKTLGSLCTSCSGTLNCTGSYCLGKYTWGLLIQTEWKRSSQLLESRRVVPFIETTECLGDIYLLPSWRIRRRRFYTDTHTDRL